MNSCPIKLIRALSVTVVALLFTAHALSAAPRADDNSQLYLLSPVDYQTIYTHLGERADLLYYDQDWALVRSTAPLNPALSPGGFPPLLLDEAPKEIYYLLVSDPLGLGEENLAQFGRIVAGFPEDKGYLLAVLSPDCTWLNAGGYDAFPYSPKNSLR